LPPFLEVHTSIGGFLEYSKRLAPFKPLKTINVQVNTEVYTLAVQNGESQV
jgi:hypothetical protein